MAIYVEVKICDRLVDVIAGQRQEEFNGEDREYTYALTRYKQFAPQTFQKNSDDMRIIKHRYSDGASVLAEKMLSAFNKTKNDV